MATAFATADPQIAADEAESLPEMDFPAHERTFHSVLAGAKWFLIHLAILLVALYFFAIGNEPVVGGFLILCSIGLLVYGLMLRPTIRADVIKGIEAGPNAPDWTSADPELSAENRP